ncbi:hypothetical protein GRI69_10280 [Erythrobacter vulgaris]|uniref:Uncharacterized protein n=1 Tax=Qipengyuania vulgaris TaxID=291985 RepID=A0A844XR85_9SPHN|nr:hypothetical protein [Qipengyuania vulgaris]MXO48645.1 hypothetical protein [Qipengyuania vulgaris]
MFDDTTMSRMSVELNYAFEHEIRPQLVNAFIDELGGYEIISARVAAGEYDFREADWISSYQEARRFMYHPNPLFPPLTEDDDDESENGDNDERSRKQLVTVDDEDWSF